MMFTYPDQIYENAIDKVMQILGNYVWPFQDIIVRKIYEKIGSARFVVLNASLTILHKKKTFTSFNNTCSDVITIRHEF